MKTAPTAHEQLFTPDSLLTEAGYTAALVALATEMKVKRVAAKTPASGKKTQELPAVDSVLEATNSYETTPTRNS